MSRDSTQNLNPINILYHRWSQVESIKAMDQPAGITQHAIGARRTPDRNIGKVTPPDSTDSTLTLTSCPHASAWVLTGPDAARGTPTAIHFAFQNFCRMGSNAF